MKYSNYAKIIDPNSEYYGQVFEVDTILIQGKMVYVKIKQSPFTETGFYFSQIQFCVTKDNEPVKIGEEYVCIGDSFDDVEIADWYIDSYKDVRYIDKIGQGYCLLGTTDFKPLHPTNKIKITAEKIEELNESIDCNWGMTTVVQKINELIQAFNRLSK